MDPIACITITSSLRLTLTPSLALASLHAKKITVPSGPILTIQQGWTQTPPATPTRSTTPPQRSLP